MISRSAAVSVFFFLAWIGVTSSSAQPNTYAMYCDGGSPFADLGVNAGNGLRSVEFWFRPKHTIGPQSNQQSQTFVARYDSPALLSLFGFYIRGIDCNNNLGRLAFFVTYNGVRHEILSDQDTWDSLQCYHVAGVIDPVQGMKLYINGVQQAMTDPAATQPTAVDANITTIASMGAVFGLYFEGSIDDMRFWDRSLAAQEIVLKKDRELDPAVETGLVGYWKFNEGSGTVVYDETSNHYDGTSGGSLSWRGTGLCFGQPPEPVAPCQQLFIPDAFSPNADGANDIFYVRGSCIEKMELRIFDRVGNKVFETNDPSQGWDGSFKGMMMDHDVFVYYLVITFTDGTRLKKKGDVSLIR